MTPNPVDTKYLEKKLKSIADLQVFFTAGCPMLNHDPMSKLLLTPAFLARITTTTRLPTLMEQTGSRTSSTSPSTSFSIRSSLQMPKLLTPSLLSETKNSRSSASASSLTASSPSTSKLSPTNTKNPTEPTVADQQRNSKLLTPAFVMGANFSRAIPSHRRHRLPIFRTITSRRIDVSMFVS